MSKKLFLFVFFIAIFTWVPAFAETAPLRLSEHDIEKLLTENNQELKALVSQAGISEAEIIQAGKINNPLLFSETESFTPANLSNGNTQLNLGLSYQFTLGGQTGLRQQIAVFSAQKTKADIQNRLREILFKAKQGYNELLHSYRLVELKKIHLHHAEEILEVLEKQYKAGEIARFEVYRAGLDKSYAEKLLESAVSEVKLDTAYLNSLLNRPLEADLVPAAGFFVPDYTSIKLQELITTARVLNPELKSIKTAIKIEELKLRLAEASSVPLLDTELAVGNQGINARVGVPLPVFYNQEGEKAVSAATISYLNRLYDSSSQQLSAEVTKAYQHLVLSVAAVNTFEKTVMSQSKNIHQLALKRLNAGEGGLMEVLEAEHTRHEHEDEYARLVLEARKNYDYLEYLTGGNNLD